MLTFVYPIISLVVSVAFLIFAVLLVLRLIFNYADLNPFGTIGRFAFKIRKTTERFVYPAARLLANFRIDSRLAPVVTLLVSAAIVYFVMQIVFDICFIIDGLTIGAANGNPKFIVGFVLYALLSALGFFIVVRVVSSWFVYSRNTFFGFVQRVTNPIMIPFQKLIPPVGMFDMTAFVVLVIIYLLKTLVLRIFVY